jgi:hypothetical protein
MYLEDNSCARQMQKDGSYIRLKPAEEKGCLNIQEWLMEATNRK